MTTKTADKKAARAKNATAIKGFPKRKIIAGLDALALGKQAKNVADSDADSASLQLVDAASQYGIAAHSQCDGDTSTVLADWKLGMRQVALELAVAGSPFAESKETDAGTVAKLTGTGNNVMSIAKGVVDFQLAVEDCTNDEGEVSYRSVRKMVEAKRAERRALENPEAAKLAEAKQRCRDAFGELAEVFFNAGDIELIDGLTAGLDALRTEEQEAQAIAATIEAEAEAA